VRRAARLYAVAVVLASAAAAAPARFERSIEVPAAGWTRVRLDGHAQARAARRLLDPQGRERPHAVLPVPRGDVAPRAIVLGPWRGGFVVDLDLGPVPFEHRALVVEAQTLAMDGAIQVSADGATWSDAVSGRVSRHGGEERWTIDHAPTTARYLRIRWPASAGVPTLARTTVVATSPGRAGSLEAVAFHPEPDPVTRAAWRLELPAPWDAVARLRIRVHGDARGAWRVYRPSPRVWERIAEGRLEAADLRIDLPAGAGRSRTGRLELASPGAAPTLEAIEVEVEPAWLLFEARGAGLHKLTYGTDAAPEPAPHEVGVPGSLREAALGPVVEQPQAALDPGLVEPRVPADERSILERFRIDARLIRAGEVAWLDLPLALDDRFGSRASGLRVLAAGREVPFVLVSRDEPALVVAEASLVPQRDARGGTSRVSAPLGAGSGSMLAVELWAGSAAGFEREVAFELEARGPLPREPARSRGTWSCDLDPIAPCRFVAELSGVDGMSRMHVVLADRGNPPLPALGLRVWRARTALAFVWPASGEVELGRVAEAEAADYDLARHAGELLGRPRVEVGLVGTEPLGEATTAARDRGLLLAALAVLCVALLLVLRRVLRT